MKFIIFLGIYVTAATAAVVNYAQIPLFYHKTMGIQEAAKIRAIEETGGLDGTRIIGGSAVALGDHPSMGGLVISLPDGLTSICGSSLISNTRAVTAAHCWFDGHYQAVQFEIVLGALTLFSGGTRITTSSVVTHPSWNPTRLDNNVAVITIAPVTLSDYIRPITLASGNNDFMGELSWAVGYGKVTESSAIVSNQTLHHVRVEVMGNPLCKWSYGNSAILESNVCTSGAVWNLGTCAGDFGGPLIVIDRGVQKLIGIASYSSRAACDRGHPSVFSRVTYYYDWILSLM